MLDIDDPLLGAIVVLILTMAVLAAWIDNTPIGRWLRRRRKTRDSKHDDPG